MSKFIQRLKKLKWKIISGVIACVVLTVSVTTLVLHNNKIVKAENEKIIVNNSEMKNDISKSNDNEKDIDHGVKVQGDNKDKETSKKEAMEKEKEHKDTEFVEKKFKGKTTTVLQFREAPKDKGKFNLDNGTIIEVLGEEGEYYKVKYKDKEGWITAKYVKEYTEEDKKVDEKAKVNKQVQKNIDSNKNNIDTNKENKNSNKNNTSKEVHKKGFNNPAFANSRQVVLVTTNGMSSSYANIKFYQKSGEDWNKKTETSGRVGANGLAYISSRKQNTNKTPAGVMNILSAFGIADNPGSKYSYRKVKNNDYWDLNNGSPNYNRLVHDNPGGDYEHLISYPKQYKYFLNTDFNSGQVSNKGGAIFIHCNGNGSTGGCVSMPENKMVELIRWLDPSQNPKIVVIPSSDLDKYWY